MESLIEGNATVSTQAYFPGDKQGFFEPGTGINELVETLSAVFDEIALGDGPSLMVISATPSSVTSMACRPGEGGCQRFDGQPEGGDDCEAARLDQ